MTDILSTKCELSLISLEFAAFYLVYWAFRETINEVKSYTFDEPLNPGLKRSYNAP